LTFIVAAKMAYIICTIKVVHTVSVNKS